MKSHANFVHSAVGLDVRVEALVHLVIITLGCVVQTQRTAPVQVFETLPTVDTLTLVRLAIVKRVVLAGFADQTSSGLAQDVSTLCAVAGGHLTADAHVTVQLIFLVIDADHLVEDSRQPGSLASDYVVQIYQPGFLPLAVEKPRDAVPCPEEVRLEENRHQEEQVE